MGDEQTRPLGEVTPLAHRGFSGGDLHSLENSTAAFRAAADLGYTWVETDVHATADGVLVAFHDDRLDRVTDATGVIGQLPWSTVSQARIDGVEPIPRLADLLDEFPTMRFNIDVKAEGAIAPLVECIEAHDAHDRVRIASFSETRRRAVLTGLSRPARSSPGSSRMAALWVSAHVPLVSASLFRRLTRGVDAVQIPERQGSVRVLDGRLLEVAHRAGVEVHVWTVNDPCVMRRLLDMGVDGIITDRADLLKDVLVARGEWSDAG